MTSYEPYDTGTGVRLQVKVKFTLEQDSKAQRGSRGMAVLLL
jgi:hypothetical protein